MVSWLVGAGVVRVCGTTTMRDRGGATTGQASAKVSHFKASSRRRRPALLNVFEQARPGQPPELHGQWSGAGIGEFNGNQTDFGGSDVPPEYSDEAALRRSGVASPAWNLPVVFGLIAVTYNLNSVSSLNLTPPRWREDIFNLLHYKIPRSRR